MPQGVGESFLDGLTGLTPSPDRAGLEVHRWWGGLHHMASSGMSQASLFTITGWQRQEWKTQQKAELGSLCGSGEAALPVRLPDAGEVGSGLRAKPESSGKNSLVSLL